MNLIRAFVVALSLGGVVYLLIDHPVLSPLLMIAVTAGGVTLAWKIGQRLQVIESARRIEPVFIVSKNPGTLEPVPLPDELDALCFHVKPKEALATAVRVRAMLQDSGNGFLAEDLPESQQLPFHILLFRDGRYVNETWEEFSFRVLEAIKTARAEWHERLTEKDRSWYLRTYHKEV